MGQLRQSIIGFSRVDTMPDYSYKTEPSYVGYNGFFSYGLYNETNKHIYDEYIRDFKKVQKRIFKLADMKKIHIIRCFDRSMEARLLVYRFTSDKAYDEFHRMINSGSIGCGVWGEDKGHDFNEFYRWVSLDWIVDADGDVFESAFMRLISAFERQHQFGQPLFIGNKNKHHESSDNKLGLVETTYDMNEGVGLRKIKSAEYQ